MRIGIQQIYDAARAAGFTPDQATTWTAIALAESGGETGALNDQGEHSVGLWQINLGAHANRWGDLTDPVANARAAYDISRQGTDMRPWTVTHASNAGGAHDYRSYLHDVSAATGYAGDPRGVDGYGAALPPPLPPSGPAQPTDPALAAQTIGTAPPEPATGEAVDLLTDPGSEVDSDADGLTDAFERMIGSRADLADSDADGLGDAYETVVSGTSTVLADSDSDALTDSAEVALGTDGGTWDTDNDGASDGVEVRFGTDPLLAESGTVPEPDPLPQPVAGPAAATESAQLPGTNGGASLAGLFVERALEQRGDTYVFGAEASLDDPDPGSFDCSELTQWAADQVGVTIPDGAMYQYLDLKGQGQLMTVEEALRTPGALLFYFSDEPTPGGSRPGAAHVAISLGDGRTIEARGSSYGVNTFDGGDPGERFNFAGMIPQMSGTASADVLATFGGEVGASLGAADPALALDPDADNDGLSDAFERLVGLDPMSSDTDSDGISDAEEQLGGPRELTGQELTAALAEQGLDAAGDEDADGLSNRYEVRHLLDARSADTDADGLSDSTEIALGTDPTALDSDHDGISDQAEVGFGTDPLIPGNPIDGWGVPADDDPTGQAVQPVGLLDDMGGLD